MCKKDSITSAESASVTEQKDETHKYTLKEVILKNPHISAQNWDTLVDSAQFANLSIIDLLKKNGIFERKSDIKLNLMLKGILPITEKEVSKLFSGHDLITLLQSTQKDILPEFPRVGEMIDRYSLIKKLGSGATSQVYLAHHPVLGQEIAIKVLSPRQAKFAKQAEINFLQEAKHLAKLRHHSFVQIYDAVKSDQYTYIVMECLHGNNLEEIMKTHDFLSLHHTLIIGGQVCRALEYIHDRGIVHRDVKPENIVLLPDSSIKLIDFGIAITKGELEEKGQEREVQGSPYYMAPEQFEGESSTSSDIYAFGALLYLLSTGKLPFISEDLGELIRLHRETKPQAPHEINPELPASFSNLILTMLEKKPAQRPQNPADILNTLGIILAQNVLPGQRSPVIAMREFLGA